MKKNSGRKDQRLEDHQKGKKRGDINCESHPQNEKPRWYGKEKGEEVEMSYKCLAKVRIGLKKTILQGNDLRFQTKVDAEEFCKMLCDPPPTVAGWEIKETTEPANYHMKDGMLVRL